MIKSIKFSERKFIELCNVGILFIGFTILFSSSKTKDLLLATFLIFLSCLGYSLKDSQKINKARGKK